MITKDSVINEILETKEGAANILISNGMGCLGCPSSLEETLEDAAEIHGLDINKLLDELNR